MIVIEELGRLDGFRGLSGISRDIGGLRGFGAYSIDVYLKTISHILRFHKIPQYSSKSK